MKFGAFGAIGDQQPEPDFGGSYWEIVGMAIAATAILDTINRPFASQDIMLSGSDLRFV
ncbi:MAG: hypothetical protein OXN89_17015 [Bryobacterales bacterium]|nr:hypothetical protein [Bryobacterales bacterium]